MRNRMREICTSGSVRDEGGNVLVYSASGAHDAVAGRRRRSLPRSPSNFSTHSSPPITANGASSTKAARLWALLLPVRDAGLREVRDIVCHR